MTDEEQTPGEDNVEKDPVFYYSREHRLSRASPVVRALNDGKFIKPSLSRRLFANKGNMMVFIAIVLVTVFGLASRFSGKEPEMKLGGNTIAVTIIREEGILILRMIKNLPKSGEAYMGEVDIAVSPVMSKQEDEIPPVFFHRVSFRPIDSEAFSISLPFEKNDFIVLLSINGEQKSMRIKVKS